MEHDRRLADHNAVIPLFVSLAERFKRTKTLLEDKPLLAHYTSVEVLEKIVQNGEVWFSNPLFMNDWEEMRYGMIEGTRAFHESDALVQAAGSPERLYMLRERFDAFSKRFENEGAYDTYIFCLSEHPRDNYDGVLSMWRGYGSHGRGAALVFDTGKLTLIPTSVLFLTKVEYATKEERQAALIQLVNDWCEILRSNHIPDDQLYMAAFAFFNVLQLFALVYKNAGFLEEHEWRVIHFGDNDGAQTLRQFFDYRLGEHGIEPKMRFPLKVTPLVTSDDFSLEKIIDRIILGPSVSSPLAIKGFERMLDKHGHGALKRRLHASQIPLRPRAG